jgi:hypothetical protein
MRERKCSLRDAHVGQPQSVNREKSLSLIVFEAMALPSHLEPPELGGSGGVTIAKILFSKGGGSIAS